MAKVGSQPDFHAAFLLGTDLVKDESILVAAYQDSQGVTAAFNLNILHRLNKELEADFDLSGFRHCARWNSFESRMEMHLESTPRQFIQIPAAGLQLDFRPGETIHTENSYKFTDQALGALLFDSGFTPEMTWKDARQWYALTLSRTYQ
jgi:uncharacterized SAM-dependent methyltransferase